jgi:hypothetical protein
MEHAASIFRAYGRIRSPLAPASFLLVLYFDTEDGGDIFLRNVRSPKLYDVTIQGTAYLRTSIPEKIPNIECCKKLNGTQGRKDGP